MTDPGLVTTESSSFPCKGSISEELSGPQGLPLRYLLEESLPEDLISSIQQSIGSFPEVLPSSALRASVLKTRS